MQKQQFEKQQQTKNKCFLIFLFIKKGKRVVKKKRKRNNATGNQALKINQSKSKIYILR